MTTSSSDLDTAFADINRKPVDERYAALCYLMFDMLQRVKLSKSDKHDVLTDLSDVLDGVQPSSRSGFVRKQ